MSWVELCQEGHFGQEEFSAVQEIARKVVAGRPAHVAELGWAAESPAIQLTHEFFARENASERLTTLCEKVSSQESFDRLFFRALDNFLIDIHRKTDVGAAARRITNLLRGDGRFVEVAEVNRWAVGDSSSMWDGDEAPLLTAAGSFAFTPVEYDSSRRRSPVISDAELRDLLETVLTAAGGAVPVGVLVDVVSRRTGFGAVPTFVELADGDVEHDGELDPVVRDEARALYDRFEENERLLLLNHDQTVREKAKLLGVAVGTVGNITLRLREKLEPYRSGDQDPRVLRYLGELLEETLDS